MIDSLITWADGYRIVVKKKIRKENCYEWDGYLLRYDKVLCILGGTNDSVDIQKSLDESVDEISANLIEQRRKHGESVGEFLNQLLYYEYEIKKWKSIAKKKLIKADPEYCYGSECWKLETWNEQDSSELRAKIFEKLPNIRFFNDELPKWIDLKKPK